MSEPLFPFGYRGESQAERSRARKLGARTLRGASGRSVTDPAEEQLDAMRRARGKSYTRLRERQ